MKTVRLRKREEERILSGHPWVYDNEIAEVMGDPAAGETVAVTSFAGRFLGRGFINPASRIRVRLFTREKEELDRALLERRIRSAWEYRLRTVETGCCRVVFAEADLLPALIVDKFRDEESGGEYLVLQTLALGMDRHKETIRDILIELFHPAGIYERNDAPVREREGLDRRRGFLTEPFETGITIRENGVLFRIDLAEGQKTGYYLDQKENHAAIAPFCPGARVLDAFSHIGGFALHALAFGARSATAVDISAEAVAAIGLNAGLNGFTDRITAVTANVFDYQRKLDSDGERFDLVILDPPAFAKSRSTVEGAYRGYKDINLRAMRLLRPGGVLVTCSCSQAMDSELFRKMLLDAATDAHRTVRLTATRTQAMDHPILLGYDESFYLKCLILQVL